MIDKKRGGVGVHFKRELFVAFSLIVAAFVCNALTLRGGNIVQAASETLQRASSAVAVVVDAAKNNPASANQAPKDTPSSTTAKEANTDRLQVAPASLGAKAAQASSSTTPNYISPGRIGIFTSDSPSDPSSLGRLDQLRSLGVDTVYNYTVLDGDSNQIKTYLDRAASDNLQIIVSLKDLYDQLGANNYRDLFSTPLGANNEEAALNVVRQFATHPAVWGFGISDEAPESPRELSQWQPILHDRYQKIKSITTKPVMAVLVGATSPSAAARRSFLTSLRSSTDTFALDYYPVPYQSQTIIRDIGGDLTAAGDNNGWFVTQAFSWASYPGTASNLGFNLSQARYPSVDEMITMSAYALSGGARNILLYSYFDIKDNPAQLAALRQAIAQLR